MPSLVYLKTSWQVVSGLGRTHPPISPLGQIDPPWFVVVRWEGEVKLLRGAGVSAKSLAYS
jgi:hypothetical protein